MSDGKKSPPSVLDVLRAAFPQAEVDAVLPSVKDDRFGITNEKDATWAAGKIAAAQNEIERRRAQCAEYVADAEANLERMRYLFETPLRGYAEGVLGDGKKRSLKLPSGTIGFRSIRPKLEIADEAEVIAWADAIGNECARTVRIVQKTALNEHWEKSGEVPPGCSVVPAEDRFYVK